MTRDEAITALKAGHRLAHGCFSSEEWIQRESPGLLVFEDGVHCAEASFWATRQSAEWQDNWSLHSSSQPAKEDKELGLYNKFEVRRTDGGSEPGRKHEHCKYFVLDLTHDKHAPPAIRTYAQFCKSEYPALSDELNALFPVKEDYWVDRPLPEDEAIAAAHPLRTGRHDLYKEAMRLVGAKHSKYALVDLINWLLSRIPDAAKTTQVHDPAAYRAAETTEDLDRLVTLAMYAATAAQPDLNTALAEIKALKKQIKERVR